MDTVNLFWRSKLISTSAIIKKTNETCIGRKERIYWIPFGTRHSLVILRAHQNSRYTPRSDVLHGMWAGFQIFNNKSVTLILIRRLKAATSIMAEWRLSSKIIEMLLYFNSSFIQVRISEVCKAFILTTPFTKGEREKISLIELNQEHKQSSPLLQQAVASSWLGGLISHHAAMKCC